MDTESIFSQLSLKSIILFIPQILEYHERPEKILIISKGAENM